MNDPANFLLVTMNRLSSQLLAWYHTQKRILPWRDHPDPYAVWVSEIMLQQTRVDTVIPYFEKWMQLFPTVKALASAHEQDVLNAWEGLGYYSRARNLHKAAKVVAEKFNGELPHDLEDLRSLPGIGRYTVGAIASMAFGMDEATLDGNLRRVFSRLFDIDEFADSPLGEKILWDLAAKNLPKGQAGDYNQALMDLGATICLPKNPRCLLCPLMSLCKSRENGTQELRPVLKPKKSVPSYVHAAGDRGAWTRAAQSAPGGRVAGGMWEFPNARIDGDPAKALVKSLKTATQIQVKKKEALQVVEHAYSHFKVTVHPFKCEKVSIPKNKNLKWVKLSELEEYPMGKVDRQIARQIK
ncbi:MAG: A/G-specific adenine glycosylase [Anaerolineales bacterium]|nr:A/G-specific adenine glycosylase [Anaerolineales bacterium]